jgi:hypothetical protein
MAEIYRIIVPVGTSWDDIAVVILDERIRIRVEYETETVIVGTYDDAYDLSSNPYSLIQYYDGYFSKWRFA